MLSIKLDIKRIKIINKPLAMVFYPIFIFYRCRQKRTRQRNQKECSPTERSSTTQNKSKTYLRNESNRTTQLTKIKTEANLRNESNYQDLC